MHTQTWNFKPLTMKKQIRLQLGIPTQAGFVWMLLKTTKKKKSFSDSDENMAARTINSKQSTASLLLNGIIVAFAFAQPSLSISWLNRIIMNKNDHLYD